MNQESGQFNENATFKFSDWEWCLDWMKSHIEEEDIENWSFVPSEGDAEDKITLKEVLDELESYNDQWKVHPKTNLAIQKMCKAFILQLLKNCAPKVYKHRFNKSIMKAAVEYFLNDDKDCSEI